MRGQTIPAGIDGRNPEAPASPTPLQPVAVTIGGIPVPRSDIFFSGLVYAGVMQVNVRVPERVVLGSLVELLISVGGVTSRQGVTLPAVTVAVR